MSICDLVSITVFLTSIVSCFGGALSAVGWVVPLIVVFTICALIPEVKWGRLIHWYPWLVLVLISGFISPYDEALHRTCIIITPISVGIVASSLKWHKKNIDFIFTLTNISAILLVIVLVLRVLIWGSSVWFEVPPQSMTAVVFIWLFAIRYKLFGNLKNIFLASILQVIVTLVIARMAMLSGLLSLFVFQKRIFSFKNILLLFLVIGILVGLLYLPSVQEKFFYKTINISNISEDLKNFNSSGRTDLWPFLIDEIYKKPYFGHGANASEPFLLAISSNFAHPHNDFLRILFDYGLFGFVLFAYGFYRQVRRLYLFREHFELVEKKYVLLCALWLFVPFFNFMITDNVLLYAAYFLNLLFLFIGISESFIYDSKIDVRVITISH